MLPRPTGLVQHAEQPRQLLVGAGQTFRVVEGAEPVERFLERRLGESDLADPQEGASPVQLRRRDSARVAAGAAARKCRGQQLLDPLAIIGLAPREQVERQIVLEHRAERLRLASQVQRLLHARDGEVRFALGALAARQSGQIEGLGERTLPVPVDEEGALEGGGRVVDPSGPAERFTSVALGSGLGGGVVRAPSVSAALSKERADASQCRVAKRLRPLSAAR